MAEKPFETRTVTALVEYRDDDGQGPTIIGHAATFNQPYQVGFFTETIHPDAFKRTLAGKPDVRLLVDHEGQPLARTKSGTLELGTDDRGLTVRAVLDPTDPDVQRLIPKMRRGDMDQMSFAFRVPTGGDAWDHSGDVPRRTVREANLSGGDVSIVTYPANENASVALRARESREAHATYLHALVEELREGRQVDVEHIEAALVALGYGTPLPALRAAVEAATEAVEASAEAVEERTDALEGGQQNSAATNLALRQIEALRLRTKRAS